MNHQNRYHNYDSCSSTTTLGQNDDADDGNRSTTTSLLVGGENEDCSSSRSIYSENLLDKNDKQENDGDLSANSKSKCSKSKEDRIERTNNKSSAPTAANTPVMATNNGTAPARAPITTEQHNTNSVLKLSSVTSKYVTPIIHHATPKYDINSHTQQNQKEILSPATETLNEIASAMGATGGGDDLRYEFSQLSQLTFDENDFDSIHHHHHHGEQITNGDGNEATTMITTTKTSTKNVLDKAGGNIDSNKKESSPTNDNLLLLAQAAFSSESKQQKITLSTTRNDKQTRDEVKLVTTKMKGKSSNEQQSCNTNEVKLHKPKHQLNEGETKKKRCYTRRQYKTVRNNKAHVYLGAFTQAVGERKKKEAAELIERIVLERKGEPSFELVKDALENEGIRSVITKNGKTSTKNMESSKKASSGETGKNSGPSNTLASENKFHMITLPEKGSVGMFIGSKDDNRSQRGCVVKSLLENGQAILHRVRVDDEIYHMPHNIKTEDDLERNNHNSNDYLAATSEEVKKWAKASKRPIKFLVKRQQHCKDSCTESKGSKAIDINPSRQVSEIKVAGEVVTLKPLTKAQIGVVLRTKCFPVVPFCKTCNGESMRSSHHFLCPKHPEFHLSGAEEKLTIVIAGMKYDCKACLYEFQHGKKKSGKHNEKCGRRSKEEYHSDQDKKDIISTSCDKGKRVSHYETKSDRKRPTSNKDSLTMNVSENNMEVENEPTKCATITPIVESLHRSTQYGGSSLPIHITDDPGPLWVTCPNPWGDRSIKDEDFVLMSPTCYRLEHEIHSASPYRFIVEPFGHELSPYFASHRSPLDGYRVLRLTRDALALRSWGFEFCYHNLGGACLVTKIDPFSPADAAVDFGMTKHVVTNNESSLGLKVHDMILCVNGKEVGGMTELDLAIELDIAGKEITCVVAECQRAPKKNMFEDSDSTCSIFDVDSSIQYYSNDTPTRMKSRMKSNDNDDKESVRTLVNIKSIPIIELSKEKKDGIADTIEIEGACDKQDESGYIEATRSKGSGETCSENETIELKDSVGRNSTILFRDGLSNSNDNGDTSQRHNKNKTGGVKCQEDSSACNSSSAETEWEEDENPWLGCICGETHESPIPVFWIQCDSCDAWCNVSPQCVGFSSSEADLRGEWQCPDCSSTTELSPGKNKSNFMNSEVCSAHVTTPEGSSRKKNNSSVFEDKVSAANVATPEEKRCSNKDIRTYDIGAVVEITDRTWVGSNKPGGAAKVIASHKIDNDVFYDVQYILENRKESNIESEYVAIDDLVSRGFSSPAGSTRMSRKRGFHETMI